MFRLTRPFVRLLTIALLAATAAACKGEDPFFIPTEPLPDPTTVVVTGTVTPNGAFTHTFFTNAFGTVQATLVSLEPDPDLAVGFALGTWNGAACSQVLVNDRATVGLTITGSVGSPAPLCLRVFDTGTLTEPVTFEARIVHP
jgi:hypothetical protein